CKPFNIQRTGLSSPMGRFSCRSAPTEPANAGMKSTAMERLGRARLGQSPRKSGGAQLAAPNALPPDARWGRARLKRESSPAEDTLAWNQQSRVSRAWARWPESYLREGAALPPRAVEVFWHVVHRSIPHTRPGRDGRDPGHRGMFVVSGADHTL